MAITIVNFSSRKDGNCEKILELLANHFQKSPVKTFSFCDKEIKGCGKCSNYNCFKNDSCSINDGLMQLFDDITNSEFAYFIIPNYCDFPCSNYFIFNERSCGYFNGKKELLDKYIKVKKKFIVISNSKNSNFKKILNYQIESFIEPSILFLSNDKFDCKSLDGNLLSKKAAVDLILNYADDNYKIEESAMALVKYKNEVLYTKEEIYNNIVVSLPKGHVEKNETHIETSIRECREETGLILDPKDYVKEGKPYEYKFIDHNNVLVKKLIYPVIYHVNEKRDTRINEERIVSVGFMTISDFLLQCSFENVKDFVKKELLNKK